MHARAVDDAGNRLRELHHEEWQDLTLAGLTLGLALAASEHAPSLALPLMIGGMVLVALGIQALWRHWDLVDRLAGEPDAYALAEVLAYAARQTTMDRRRRFAALVRDYLESEDSDRTRRIGDAADDLAALADELEDETLELSPGCAVACSRLMGEPTESPLLNPALPRDGLRSSARRIRSGFTARQRTACDG
jgi:hypothetical protein